MSKSEDRPIFEIFSTDNGGTHIKIWKDGRIETGTGAKLFEGAIIINRYPTRIAEVLAKQVLSHTSPQAGDR